MEPKGHLSTSEFARLAGITERAARMALAVCRAGGLWRGHRLRVKTVPAPGGLAYQVDPASLPPELRESLPPPPAAEEIESRPATTRERGSAYREPTDDPLFTFKMDCVAAVRELAASEGKTLEEAAAELAKRLTYPAGKRTGRPVSNLALERWERTERLKGTDALRRDTRKDADDERTFVNRRFDQVFRSLGGTDDELKELGERLRRQVKGQINPGKGKRGAETRGIVQENLGVRLRKLLRDRGCNLPGSELRKICRLPDKFFKKTKDHQNANTARTDARSAYSKLRPGVFRDWSGDPPMTTFAVDVHHLDLLFERPDGTTCTPKLTAGYDCNTNRLTVRVRVFDQGKGPGREMTIAFLADVFSDSRFGVPSSIYIDNGKEFLAYDAANDLINLKRSAIGADGRDEESPCSGRLNILRQRPHNAKAKNIEHVFRAIERDFVSLLPGSQGGDRMKKKTENQGRDPIPFDGDEAKLQEVVDIIVAAYNNKPQPRSKLLKGRTPNEMFDEAYRGGWRAITMPVDLMQEVFFESEERTVKAGGLVSWKGSTYRSDKLLTKPGQKIEVRRSLAGDTRSLSAYLDNEWIDFLYPETPFASNDIEGAREQSRREGEMNRQLKALDDECEVIDPWELVKERAKENARPEAEDIPVIGLNGSASRARDGKKAARLPGETNRSREAFEKQANELAWLGSLKVGGAG